MEPGSRFRLWPMVKTLFSTYPFNLYIGLLALSLMHVSFPEPLYQLADTVAAANPVVVMLMLGIMFEVRLGPAERHQVLGIVTSRVLTEAVMAATADLAAALPPGAETHRRAAGLCPHQRNGYCILRQAPVRSQCIRHGNFPDHPHQHRRDAGVIFGLIHPQRFPAGPEPLPDGCIL